LRGCALPHLALGVQKLIVAQGLRDDIKQAFWLSFHIAISAIYDALLLIVHVSRL
jgi:hypothetical protein